MEVHIKKKVTKEVEVTIEYYELCDKCNNKIEPENYDAFECNFEYITGQVYPDSHSKEITEMQICENCVDDFIKLLKDNGYRLNKRESER